MKKLHKEIDLVLQIYLPDDYFYDLRNKLIPKLAQLFESKHLHKPVVVRGGDSETESVPRVEKLLPYPYLNTIPNTPTELLGNEAMAKGVSDGLHLCRNHKWLKCECANGKYKCEDPRV